MKRQQKSKPKILPYLIKYNKKKKTDREIGSKKPIQKKIIPRHKLIIQRIVVLLYTFLISCVILEATFIITIIIPNTKIKYIKKEETVLFEIIQTLATNNETMLAFWIFIILFILSILLYLVIEKQEVRKHLTLPLLSILAILSTKLILHFNETRSLFKDIFLSLPEINIQIQHFYTIHEKLDYITQICGQNNIKLTEQMIQQLAHTNLELSDMPHFIKEASNTSLFPSKETWWFIISWIPNACNIISFCENHWKLTLTTIVLSISFTTLLIIYCVQYTPNNPLPSTQGIHNTYMDYLQTINFFKISLMLLFVTGIAILCYYIYYNQPRILEKLNVWIQKLKELK